MILSPKSLNNVVLEKDFVNHHVNYINSIKMRDFSHIAHYELKISFFKLEKFRTLVFSKKTKENLINYRVPKDIRYDVLRSLPNRRDSILIDESHCLRYIKTDTEIYGCFDTIETGKTVREMGFMIHNYFFHIDLINEKVLIDSGTYNVSETLNQDLDSVYQKFLETHFNQFMVVVTYLELTPVTLNIIEAGRSYGTRRDEKYKNATHRNFILVNTNWNVETISLQNVHVRGHMRLQPYGTGRSLFKFIHIEPYTKGITRRLPQKETNK